MEQLMEQMRRNKSSRTMTLGLLRDSIYQLGTRFNGDELEQEILEAVTESLYTEVGFAGWWLRKRAYWDRFLEEAQRQEALWKTQDEDAKRCAFWDTLTNDVLDYLEQKGEHLV